MSDRLFAFERIENFRDFGGYSTGSGTMARGVLWRSGMHARATDADLEKLDTLDLSAIVDLRRKSERLNQPSRRPPLWQGAVIESDLGGDGEAPHIEFLKTQSLTPQSGRNYMATAYRRMPFEEGHVALFRAYFEALSSGRGPVLIHCAAGKDRTGLLAAITHKVLGVSEDDMMADYLATNAAIDLEGRAEIMGERLSKLTGQKVPRDAVIAFLGVEPQFLDQAWSAIDEQCGSFQNYLEQVLLLSPKALERVRQACIL